jgi:hypothetical protein
MGKYLRREQLEVIDDLFEAGLSEAEVADKHDVPLRTLWKWMEDERFALELGRRMVAARRERERIISRYGPFAAAKLVELMSSGSGETARKAALDVIGLPEKFAKRPVGDVEDSGKDEESLPEIEDIDSETAGKILAILAEDQ